jgi:hypothetical protein
MTGETLGFSSEDPLAGAVFQANFHMLNRRFLHENGVFRAAYGKLWVFF